MKSVANHILTECAACLCVILDVLNLFRGFQRECVNARLDPAPHPFEPEAFNSFLVGLLHHLFQGVTAWHAL
jgi:hypothetical protein